MKIQGTRKAVASFKVNSDKKKIVVVSKNKNTKNALDLEGFKI